MFIVLYKKYGNLHTDDITGIAWTNDSRFFLTWSKDLTMKMMSLHKLEGFLPFTFSGNKKKIVRAFFSEDNQRIVAIAKNGRVTIWKWTENKSEASQKMLEFDEFKKGKRLKLSDNEKPNTYHPSEQDSQYYTALERDVAKGRFLLEKVTKFTLQ